MNIGRAGRAILFITMIVLAGVAGSGFLSGVSMSSIIFGCAAAIILCIESALIEISKKIDGISKKIDERNI